MAWIKMRCDLPQDPAVYKLAALTKLDRFAVIGRLYAFWSWADKHAVDGRVDGATAHVVDDIASCPGFADALAAVKWLALGQDFIHIPNHERHNGQSAKERGLKNVRQSLWRGGKINPMATFTSPSTEPSTSPSTPTSTEPSTKPSTRLDKIRVEEEIPNVGQKPDLAVDSRIEAARRIFEHWRRTLNHPKAIPDKKRLGLIADRIKQGYSEDDLKRAINGVLASPHHMGKNDSQTIYDGVELIFRDAAHVDKFLGLVSKDGPKAAAQAKVTPCCKCDQAGTLTHTDGKPYCVKHFGEVRADAHGAKLQKMAASRASSAGSGEALRLGDILHAHGHRP